MFLRVCRGGVDVLVNLTGKTRGLMIDGGDVMSGAEGGGEAVGRVVVPVQVSVHGGESELQGDIQTVYIPVPTFFFIFPELQHRVQTK